LALGLGFEQRIVACATAANALALSIDHAPTQRHFTEPKINAEQILAFVI
jgi:hypothetical protein